jgi:hypothetical protein
MDDHQWRLATVTEVKVDHAAMTKKNKNWLLFVMFTMGSLMVYSMWLLRVRNGETLEYWHLVTTCSVNSLIDLPSLLSDLK